MRLTSSIVAPVLVILLVFSGALFLTFADDGTPALPGITVKDEYPNSCVDCHKQSGDSDYRLNVSLKESGHTDITAIVKNLPGDCGMCHREGSGAGALNLQTHLVHFENPEDNVFITAYGGKCLACHALDTETGIMTVKSGRANW